MQLPDTPLPAPSSSTTSKRLKNSRSFPLINSTNRANTPAPDVFSTASTSTKTLRRKQSRGVLQDDTSERTLTRVSSGKSERGLKSRASFQKYAPHTSHRLRRQDNSTKSLRSEYRETNTVASATTTSSLRGVERESVRVGKESERKEGKGVSEKRAGKRRSFEEPVLDNTGSTPIPRSKSDPLSASTHASTLITPSNSATTTSSKEDSDEETKKYDPKEVFSKERFLNRHSRDFGHLYARPATSSITPQNTEQTEGPNGEDAIEDLIIPGPEVDIALARKEGREKRRSWALYRAGLVSPVPAAGSNGWTTPHSAPAASTSHTASISQSQQSISGRPGHHRRVSSFLTGAHHPSVNPSPGLTASPQISTVQRQTVLSGGFKPLALVAVTKGISSSPAGPERPVQRRNRWSMGSSASSPYIEAHASAVALLHHTRDDEEEELSVIAERESEKSRTSTRLSVSSADHSRASLSSIPAHLRNHSSSTTSSSLSSLGAVINGSSPSKSTSSCSSGGEHLGGPKVLSGESFNFRMSVVSGGGRRKSGLLSGDHDEKETGQSLDDRMTWNSAASSGFDNLRTDSRMTLRGGRLLDGQIDPEDALAGNDRDSRAARRRARAFLVAGLKLEEGSLYHEHEEQPMSPSAKMDATRRAGVVLSQPIEWNDEAPMQENRASRKRYSVMRAEKSVPLQVSQVQSPITPNASLGTSLLWRQHELQSGASSASSYYTADEQPLHSPSEAQFDIAEPGFTEIFDTGIPVLGDRYRGRESVSPITISSSAGTARMSPGMNATSQAPSTGLAAPGITIAIYDPSGHARQASLASVRRDSIGSDRPVPTRDDSSGSSTDMHLGQQGLNSLELERQLFFDHRSVRSANSDAFKSVRKVKSDIGLGANQIALPTGRSMSRPTSPVIIHQDSAGASPGRHRKTGWSKGVREWWRDDAKANAENETERGFG
ncbi:hypothetical protein QFC22_003693 [Naganishia vaughanmartiniae]|uniref:Uncharacterized protein n=1 Tax=Naganishia vaughanmartiniae TaxID=1424756 RepID=A0ACC2X815_9TREE|nr:hypothetical protein QFC22_003693 [Naganishia vaughanmartiniae]